VAGKFAHREEDPRMMDPRQAADDAARKIRDHVPMFGLLPREEEPFIQNVTAIVLTAITRCMSAPNQGLNDK
jgi:hypothetical protein